MDALKDRVGVFTESISIMACPVLVAVALKKADLVNEGNFPVQHSISPLAGISLCLCSVAFIFLSIASELKRVGLSKYAYFSSKVLVCLCAVAQMLLALMVFLLIGMRFEGYMALPIIFIVFLSGLLYLSLKSGEDINRDNNNWDTELEPSLDFSAAVTSLLFLGLEGLALEGQISVGKKLDPRLLGVLPLTYCICVVASSVMFLATVPPISYAVKESCQKLCKTLHCFCGVLTLAIAIVLLAITYLLEKEAGLLVPGVSFLCLVLIYAVLVCDKNNRQHAVDPNQHKPVSLELTKVTFTAFLVVSLPCFGDDQISSSTHVFIVSTALSVLFGLAWRFLTHFNQKAAFQTATVACVATHMCLAVAVVSLVCMGMQALADASDEECHIACNNSTQSNQLQLDLFAKCFAAKARQANSYTLSSVKCVNRQ